MGSDLQWGGRFNAPPDDELLRFGSSLTGDLVLAPFDLWCSRAHVAALRSGKVVSTADSDALERALRLIEVELADGTFSRFAQAGQFEDIHGAIDARVREIAGVPGERLHAGRSRNDQVATTLALFTRDRAVTGARVAASIARCFVLRAREELAHGTILSGMTHWQPAQPILLAFWLAAAAEMFVRSVHRFSHAETNARASCPLGSAALCGSSLPLDRSASAQVLGFDAPSRNAMDAIGTRDAALDVAHAYVRAVVDASRVCEELVIWCTPAFGYARLGDAASTGSSLMPQKRNPDPLELIRSYAPMLNALYSGALGTQSGIALSYHRDLQTTKALILEVTERGLAALRAFDRALLDVTFDRERMAASTVVGDIGATDRADRLILEGKTARDAHAEVGAQVARSEEVGLDPAFDALASVEAKRTSGSTSSHEVRAALDALTTELDELESRA